MNNILDSIISPLFTIIIAKYDSAASNHHFTLRNIEVLQDVVSDKSVPTVVLTATSTLTANETGQLPISSTLSSLVNKTSVFDNLQHSIISRG